MLCMHSVNYVTTLNKQLECLAYQFQPKTLDMEVYYHQSQLNVLAVSVN